MNSITLLISALYGFGAAGIYLYIGQRLRQRQIENRASSLAWRFFVMWWFGLAATTLIGALMTLLGLLNLANLSLFVILTHLNLLSICLALSGLLYYLLYLFTGNARLLWPLIIFYGVYYVWLVFFVTGARPIGVSVERWQVALEYEQSLTDSPFFWLIVIFLLFPQIIGSLAYFSLYFKVRQATQKYRVLLVSWSIILWFGSAFLAAATGLSNRDAWQIVSRLIGLSAALAIFIAYFPPNWIKRKYGIVALDE